MKMYNNLAKKCNRFLNKSKPNKIKFSLLLELYKIVTNQNEINFIRIYDIIRLLILK